MKNKIPFLVLTSLLLFSCSNDITPSKDDIIYNESEKKVDCISGAFGNENEVYTSKKVNSLCLLNTKFNEGTFDISFKVGNSLQENGIVFNYVDANNYYFIGLDLTSNIVIKEVLNSTKNNIFRSKTIFDATASINISLVKVDDRIEIYSNDEFLYEFKVNSTLNNTKTSIGLLAGSKNTIYSNINFVENRNNYLSNYDYFRVASGNYDYNEDQFISLSKNSILVSDTRTLENGTIEVDVSLSGDYTDNGIIFNLEENNKETYWESGVSYYFYFVNLNGYAFLGKVNNGSWSPLAYSNIENFDPIGNYKLKIVKDNDKIYCFLDNKIVFMCIDSSIKGNKVALRAGGKNIGFSSLKIDGIISLGNNEEFNVYEGEISASSSHFSSTVSKTIATMKNFEFNKGTLEAILIPGSSNNNGIIFKASNVNNEFSYYWLYFTATNQVSFSKITNGVEKKEINKFLPYGRNYSRAYNIKIVIKNNDIYCYFDNRLSFFYHDDELLSGTEVGIKSVGNNTSIFNISKVDEEKIETYEYLIFGHSYTEYWYTYKSDFSEYEDIYDIGMGASNTYHWTNQYLNEVIAYKPHYGIYWNGINDISAGYKANDIANNVKVLLTTMKQQIPNFEVALVGVNRCPSASGKRNEISSVNALYKDLGNTYDFIHYVEVEKLYCDSNGNELGMYFTDGLHPNHEGYKMAALLIKDALK